MPPAAATECERTGWTLLMIATVAPASAAARAARWPARPAPMIRTSWAGMPVESIRRRAARRPGGPSAPAEAAEQRPADLVERDHADAARPRRRRPSSAPRRAQRRLGRAAPRAAGRCATRTRSRRRRRSSPTVQRRPAAGDRVVDALLRAAMPSVAAVLVDDREPRPAVAQEELVLGVAARCVAPGIADRLARP